MDSKKPRFAAGDAVCERFSSTGASTETGIVIERYELDNEYRYVVRFENGREEVFFERELVSIEPK